MCSYEGFYKIEKLFASLPIRRAEMVYARYASSMLAIINAIALSAIFGALLKVLAIRADAQTMSLVDATAAFFASSFLVFGYLPVYFKLGYLRSRLFTLSSLHSLELLFLLISLLLDALGISFAISNVAAIIIGILLLYSSWVYLHPCAVRFFKGRAL